MQFNQLRYVLEAADKKSFSAAAKSLFVSDYESGKGTGYPSVHPSFKISLSYRSWRILCTVRQTDSQQHRAVKRQYAKIQFPADRNSEAWYAMDWRVSKSSTSDYRLS